jgi:hypothetical protein
MLGWLKLDWWRSEAVVAIDLTGWWTKNDYT